MVTVQDPIPVQAPVQPTKMEFGDGVGSRRTTVPTRWVVEHSWPELPGGFAHAVLGGEMFTTPVPPCTPVTNTSRIWGRFASRSLPRFAVRPRSRRPH